MQAATDKKKKTPQIKKVVTFVCTGNTCRSPMAQAIFSDYIKKNKIKGIKAISAGISIVKGDKLNDNAAQALKERGIEFAHTAKALTFDTINKSDFIICMTTQHKNAIGDGKAVTIGQITGGKDVSDPYGQSIEVYRSVLDYLTYACKDIVDYINDKDKTTKSQQQ